MTSDDEYCATIEVEGVEQEVFAMLYDAQIEIWDETLRTDWRGHSYYNDAGEAIRLPDDCVLQADEALDKAHGQDIYAEKLQEGRGY